MVHIYGYPGWWLGHRSARQTMLKPVLSKILDDRSTLESQRGIFD